MNEDSVVSRIFSGGGGDKGSNHDLCLVLVFKNKEWFIPKPPLPDGSKKINMRWVRGDPLIYMSMVLFKFS